MDAVYNILARAINIDKDREEYTKLYSLVKKTILDGLKQNKEFVEIFSHDKICGSYADNLKISKPNEFDLVMRFNLPDKDNIHIIADKKQKGNVLIDLTDVLINLERSANPKEISLYNFLKKIVSDEGFLLENKFKNWFQSCMQKLLNKIGKVINYNETQYCLTYQNAGPAHTIYVQNLTEDEPYFSIDFVPGFVFEVDKSVSLRELKSEFWEAIPRPLKCGIQKDNPSFRTSYTDSERKILDGKYQMKNILRLVKKFRDRNPKLKHLKSYYIKTLFLWIDEEEGDEFWRKPIFKIITVVFTKLEEALQRKEIKFYWDAELNMLNTVKPQQINEMYHVVRQARRTLEYPKSQKKILTIFLSAQEQEHLTNKDMQLIADSLQIPKRNNLIYQILLGLLLSAIPVFVYVWWN